MFDFEKIHKNHKWAFVDGFLCGLAIYWIVSTVKTDVNDAPPVPKKRSKKSKKNHLKVV